MYAWRCFDAVSCYIKSMGLVEGYLDRWKFANSAVPGKQRHHVFMTVLEDGCSYVG
ncbi:hypothetical protein IC575_015952 [Cucumis melo]